jgi:photosystem II stability/assembly factor-like uncharacterized protein
MKLLVIFLIFALSIFQTLAQWAFQNPFPTNAVLHDIQFVDDNYGWAVGEYGTILHSSDGGLSWEEQHSCEGFQTGYFTFLKVHFIDHNNGWAVGRQGDGYVVAQTSNGGSAWFLSGGGEYVFHDVAFTNPYNGCVIAISATGDGSILHSDNGGVTWDVQYSIAGKKLTDICFIDDNNGWAVGDNGTILYTNDGGLNWEGTGNITMDIKSVCFIDENNGWVAGLKDYPITDRIYHTSDGGISWELIYEFMARSELSDVTFEDPDHGWIAYQDMYYGACVSLFSTEDGGTTWNENGFTECFNQVSIDFVNNKGWAIGENMIMMSNNGGVDWVPQNSVSITNFKSVMFLDQNKGWALGAKSTYGQITNSTSQIWHTNDGGMSWQIEDGGYATNGYSISSMFFLDSDFGWASQPIPPAPPYFAKIIKTDNGGIDWVEYWTDYSFRDMYFIDADNGWGASGGIFRTSDGGENWGVQIYGGLIRDIRSMFFIEHSYNHFEAWAVGSDTNNKAIILHNDNAIYSGWQTQLNNDYNWLNSVYFIDSDKGWAVGNDLTILHTSNGGTNWIQQVFIADSGCFNSVYFTDQNHGWIVGTISAEPYFTEGYATLYTIDGGDIWELSEYRPYGELSSVCFSDENRGWAVGSNGTIMHINNGGTVGEEPIEHKESQFSVEVFPNPTKSFTTFKYFLENNSNVLISIFNPQGQVIEVIESQKSRGVHKTSWDSEGFSSGIYYYTIQAGDVVGSGKIVKLE